VVRAQGAEEDRHHAESLLPLVDALLAEAGVGLEAIARFAVSVGPGSFTSLRVGIATVKGLAFAGEQPVAPVSTLAALAHGARLPAGFANPVVALLDARRGEAYAAAFAREGDALEALPALLPESVYTPEELAKALPARCTLVGEGARLLGEAIAASLGPRAELTLVGDAEPGAEAVGVLGARLLAAGGGVSAEALVPRYVRRAEAEVVRTGTRLEE
jgi:tRNA threonylcarbamoyladenosine biosynthesis protein TsaB